MKIGRIKELQHDLDTMHPRHPMTDSRPAGESTVRRVTPHYCGVCGTEVACVSDLLSERDTRIARAEAELKDERLAFAHANEVVGKLEADLAQARAELESDCDEYTESEQASEELPGMESLQQCICGHLRSQHSAGVWSCLERGENGWCMCTKFKGA
jgi:hypothetical protein